MWNGYFFPKATPTDLVLKMNKALGVMLDKPDMKKRMEELGLQIVPAEQRTPEYIAKLLPEEIERWGKVIRDAGIGGQ